MSEPGLVFLIPLRLAIVVGFAFLYALGGRFKKVLFRRILGTVWLSAATIGLSLALGSFTWWLLAALPGYFGALSLGYGGDTLGKKVARRAVYGLVLGSCSVFFAASKGMWGLAGFQIGLAIASGVILGVFNPVKDAANEEGLISTLAVVCVPFMV